MKTYVPIEPRLSKETLRSHGRSRQIYDLEPRPYGNTDDPEHNALSYWQIRARPDDLLSPFIWGHAALMLVCGGYFTPSKAPKIEHLKSYKPQRVTNGFGEESTSTKPDPSLSNLSTTNGLLLAMMLAGFTWEECGDCLMRHEHAGGAYWAWMHQEWDQDTLIETLKDLRDSKKDKKGPRGVRIPDHGPLSIKGRDPWKDPLLSLSGIPDKESSCIPSSIHLGTGEVQELDLRPVKEILHSIRSQCSTSQIMGGPDDAPVRVVGPGPIKSDKSIKFYGASRPGSLIDDLYLPWLMEVGALVEHTDLHKVLDEKGKARARGPVPHKGYRLADDLDEGVLCSLWPVPSSLPSFPVKEIEQIEPSEPLTMEKVLELVG